MICENSMELHILYVGKVCFIIHHFDVFFQRFHKLKEFLVPLLSKDEWVGKVDCTLTLGNWNLIGKVVKVLQVIKPRRSSNVYVKY